MCEQVPLFWTQCRECDEGEVWKGRWLGDWESPPEDIYGRCEVCGGSGFILSDDPELEITLEDLDRADLETA